MSPISQKLVDRCGDEFYRKNASYNDFWRCWLRKPTEAERRETPGGEKMRDRLLDILGIICAIMLVAYLVFIAFAFNFMIQNNKNEIQSGRVIDKYYTPGCVTKYGYQDERYTICIEGYKNGEIVNFWFEASADEYGKYEVGDVMTR